MFKNKNFSKKINTFYFFLIFVVRTSILQRCYWMAREFRYRVKLGFFHIFIPFQHKQSLIFISIFQIKYSFNQTHWLILDKVFYNKILYSQTNQNLKLFLLFFTIKLLKNFVFSKNESIFTSWTLILQRCYWKSQKFRYRVKLRFFFINLYLLICLYISLTKLNTSIP